MSFRLWNNLNTKIDKIWAKVIGLEYIEKCSLVVLSLNIIAFLVFLPVAIISDVVATQYLTIAVVVYLGVCTIMSVWIFVNILRHLAIVICAVLSVSLAVMTFYVNAIGNFFKVVEAPDTEKVSYAVVTTYSKGWEKKGLGYLGGSKIGMLKDTYSNKAGDALKKEIIDKAGGDYGVSIVEFDDIYALYDAFTKKIDNLEIVALTNAQIGLLASEIEGFENKIIVLSTFSVKIAEDVMNISNKDIDDSFLTYVSTIKQYEVDSEIPGLNRPIRASALSDTQVSGQIMESKLLAVNSSTHKILIVNVAPDYYVRLTDSDEMYYELSDIGIYGTQKIIDVNEQLFDMEIDSYIQATEQNLESLAREVGISDAELSQDGGKHALDLIMNRVTSSNIMLRNLSPILMVAGNTFITNIPTNLSTGLFRSQTVSKAEWGIEEYNVTGEMKELLISEPSTTEENKSVLTPSETSLNMAKQKLQSILNGN